MDSNEEGDVTVPGRSGASLKSALIILVVLGGTLALMVDVCRRLSTENRYRAEVVAVVVGAPGHPVIAESIAESLEVDAMMTSEMSIFAPDLTLQVRQRFESDPWVERVLSVRRRFPERVEVRVRVKEPFCCAERDGVFLLVDRQGRILPGEYDQPLIDRPLISIRPVDGSQPSLRGLTDDWFVAAVAEGAAIIDDLDRHWNSMPYADSLEITAVDVSNYGGRMTRSRSEVVLATNQYWIDGNRSNTPSPVLLNWGRSSRHPMAVLELPVQRKLEHVAKLIDEHRGLHDVRVADVRFDRVVWRSTRQPDERFTKGR